MFKRSAEKCQYERVEFSLGKVRVRAAGLLCLPQVNDAESTVSVEFTPTIPHCSMATLIGLSIKVKLLRSLPDRFKVSSQTTGQSKRKELCLEQLKKKKVLTSLQYKITRGFLF